MRKVIKYILSGLISAAAIACIAKFALGVFNDGIAAYTSNIDSAVETKRAELISRGVFHEGISVNGIAIGGLTFDEALELLRPIEDELVGEVGYTVRLNDDNVLDIGSEYFDISYDTEEVLSEAMLLASEGELESIRRQIDDIAENGREFTINCKVKADTERISDAVKEFGMQFEKEPKNAKVKVNPESVYDGGDRFEYKPGKDGYRVNVDEAIEKLLDMAKKGEYGKIELKGETIEPSVSLDDIKDTIVMRSHYESSYAHAPYNFEDRVFNIIKACGLVNGTVLPPKDKSDSNSKDHVFSTNATLGPRTEALGWLPAPGFVNGGAKSVDSPGGGVCHVSSTLYNAVVRADLKVVSRLNHSAHVGYVPWGLDATIFTGGTDFKFANNTKHNIYVFMWVNSKKQKVCCEIWGDPFPDDFDSIDFYADLVETIEPTETEYKQTSKLEEPYWYIDNYAKVGYKYQSFKQYYLKGKPVGDPIKVAVSEYRMHPMRICVWKGFDPTKDMLHKQYRIDPDAVPDS